LGVLIIELVMSVEFSPEFGDTVIEKHGPLVARCLGVGE
jgi:hypothetical protein